MNRRTFIGTGMLSGAAACCYGFNSTLAAGSKKNKSKNRIGIQLYSIKDFLQKDIEGSMKKIGDMGYSYVEAYGYNGNFLNKSLKEWSLISNDFGMQLSGTHCGTGLLPADVQAKEWDYWKKGIVDLKDAGGKHLVQPWLPAKTLDELKRLAEQFNKIGEMCKKGGVRFGYHNHHAEFKEMEEHVILDVLLQNTDPKLVFFQLDMGHAVNGGGDILGYLRNYPGRFLSWHASDFKKGKGYCEVGEGDVPYDELFKLAESYGLEDLTVEQEITDDIYASCKRDFDFLVKYPWTRK